MTAIDFDRQTPITGDLNVSWIHGSPRRKANTDPPIQVHWHDEHTAIMRQNKAIHYEAPFMYLMFGNAGALLLDTGATESAETFPLRAEVDRLIASWLRRNPREEYRLTVLHSHGHGDHVAGDAQFDGRPDTVIVSRELADVTRHLGFDAWPAEVVRLDLGGRVLDVTGIPGHHDASIALYDAWTGWLLTGDTVYPGRLYVEDIDAFIDSIARLVALAGDRQVTAVMGCHIEMTRSAGRDYPLGSTYQPSEPPLQLPPSVLTDVLDAAHEVRDKPGAHAFREFLIFNGPCRWPATKSMARGWRDQLSYTLGLRK